MHNREHNQRSLLLSSQIVLCAQETITWNFFEATCLLVVPVIAFALRRVVSVNWCNSSYNVIVQDSIIRFSLTIFKIFCLNIYKNQNLFSTSPHNICISYKESLLYLTNSLAYGTRRFNAAFTGTLL